MLVKRIHVAKFIIHKPEFKLKKYANGRWNISELIKIFEKVEQDSNAHNKEFFNWRVKLPSFQINSGVVEVSQIFKIAIGH